MTAKRGGAASTPARGGYASRGALKLEAALDRFAIPVAGRRALDAGASSGGFTDLLLVRGAREVVAVDVAYGQFDWRLRNDHRVRLLERTNVRDLTVAQAGGPVGIVAADLSFISLRTVRVALLGVCEQDTDLVLLVKPQFEAPREQVEHGGVVTNPTIWRDALARVAAAYRDVGCALLDAVASPLVGPKGNREFFLHLRRSESGDRSDDVLDSALAAAP
ncbi:MAG: TlyA family RNA methyltransferase [Actinomycetota bacterium]